MFAVTIAPSVWLRAWLSRVGISVGLGLRLAGNAAAIDGNVRSMNVGNYSIENWQVEQGLPQISITSIAQTPDGYLWLGTFNGLVRFDGARFTVFNEANTPVLGKNGILRLITDRQGGLWVMTEGGGLARLADGQFTAFGPERGLPACGAAALVQDLDGGLRVVDRNGGLHQVENGKLGQPDREEARSGADVGLLVAPSEPCWVERQGKAINSSQAPLRLPIAGGSDPTNLELTIICATRCRAGGLWLAATPGVYRLQAGRLQEPAVSLPQPIRGFVAMAEDSEGSLWIGTWADGLFRRDRSGRWQRFGTGAGLAENDVSAIFVDRENNVWVGTGSGGLHRFKPRIFQTYDSRDGLTGNNVMSVSGDRQGRLWIGINGGGLNRWENGRFAPVTEPSELRQHPLVYSVLADREDAVWVGIYGQVVLRLRGGEVTAYDLGEGKPESATPRAIFEDHSGAIWLGCDRGLVRHHAGQITRYTRRNGLAHDEVRALAQDRQGTLYVGTYGGGLNCFRADRFSSYTTRDGLPDDHVTALWVDGDDTLWIGTVNGGLSRFKGGRFATITTRDGLPSNTIGTLLEDDAGHLWLGSNRGIVRVNRRELNEYLDGRQRTLTGRVFNHSDGLNSIDCSGRGQPASCKTRDGRLWFATVHGLAVVDPAHLPFNSLSPPVLIEEVLVDEAPVARNILDQPSESIVQRTAAATTGHQLRSTPPSSATRRLANPGNTPADKLVISPGRHRLEFLYTGLSLVAPEKVRFRYRLSGLDEDWIEAGSQRTASYNHVPPGQYRFEVAACNNDGVWSDTEAALDLVVLPPWWRTWWFRALTVIGVAGLVLGWYEQRLHRLRREHLAQESFSRQLIASQEKERQRVAGELHDGLGQDLLVIAGQAQLTLRQEVNPAGTVARLEDIAETAKKALQQARRMAHNLRPGLVEELGFTKAVRATVDKAAQASGLSVAADLTDVDGLLPPEFEVNLFRIVQEALNNVLKHAGASAARITLAKETASLRLVVEDNGRGFEPGPVASERSDQRGFGLRQMAERARIMGGKAEIVSRSGLGTRLTVEVPLPGARSAA